MTEGSPSLSKLLPWVVATAAVFCAAWFGVRYTVTRTENTQLADQRALADIALKAVQAQLDAERVISSRLAVEYKALQDGSTTPVVNQSRLTVIFLKPMPAFAPGALAVAVWDPVQQQGVFAANNLPSAPAGSQYQLWLKDGEPVNAGTVGVREDGTAQVLFKPGIALKGEVKVILTREAAGVVPVRPGEVVLAP